MAFMIPSSIDEAELFSREVAAKRILQAAGDYLMNKQDSDEGDLEAIDLLDTVRYLILGLREVC